MQDFSVAFGRVTRATIAANPELKSQVNDWLNRAYFNLHGTSISAADPQWVSSITGSALQLCLDQRTSTLTSREFVQLFENVIRISEEHIRESRRHTAMAFNVFYLKETSLDATLQEDTAPYKSASPKVVSVNMAHSGRVDVPKLGDPLV